MTPSCRQRDSPGSISAISREHHDHRALRARRLDPERPQPGLEDDANPTLVQNVREACAPPAQLPNAKPRDASEAERSSRHAYRIANPRPASVRAPSATRSKLRGWITPSRRNTATGLTVLSAGSERTLMRYVLSKKSPTD